MDRHRSDRPSGAGAGERIDGGDISRRLPPSRWSDGADGDSNDHHRFTRPNAGGFNSGFNGGGGGFNAGGGSGRFHPYHDGSRGGGPGFRGGPDGGFGPKRGFSGRGGGEQEYADGNKFVKLFVGSVPRTATEEDIHPLFEEHGNVIEVALISKGGQQQGFCFVKYATLEEADRAIAALHNQYTLPGAFSPLQVKYADGDRERQEDKLFVASLNKRATEQEIAEIFTPYGNVEDVYLMRDELKQFRGCGFVRFSSREMAAAAMNALHGTYVMRGCDHPLIVRFADPKRPRPEPRGFPAFGGPGSGHRSETATEMGLTAKFDEPVGGRMPPNAWGTVSPQSRGPSSQATSQGFGASQGFGSSTAAKVGVMEASSATTGIVGEAGGPQSNFAATSMLQGFNPSMPQIHQQMQPLQKPHMTQQNFPHPLQPHQYPQMPISHSEVQKTPMQQLGQLQVPQSTGLPSNQTLPFQPLPGMGGQLPSSQPIIQQNASGTPLQTPLGLPHQGMPSMANQQQLLQRPMQQMPSQLPQVMLQQQAQALQSSFQSSQQAIYQLQQQLQLMQQSGLSQQQMSHNAKQQHAPWSGPQLNASASATASTPPAVMSSAASATSMPVTTAPAAQLTCNWTEHTSPQGFKYYYNSVTQESKWEKPEEYSIFEQQQQQQQQKLAVHQLQSPAQTQSQTQVQPNQQIPQTQIQPNQQIPQTQIQPNQQISQTRIQPNQQIPQTQQVQNQMQFRQQAQMPLLQPSLAYQASAMGNQQSIQNFNYGQLQAANSVSDPARAQQAIQTAQELTWQNKPSGS